ncbi:hypothetical protein AVEN_173991-1 [Araneus ventricosus]|uniref:Uncharacterized protein n=1 Tax=Araneus ventricosus TaxID=182803 RepID=A0A4Y2RDC2_ARAVE|nr:hypothetical protein AVEN_173991-1 [Araneus ventricosus]
MEFGTSERKKQSSVLKQAILHLFKMEFWNTKGKRTVSFKRHHISSKMEILEHGRGKQPVKFKQALHTLFKMEILEHWKEKALSVLSIHPSKWNFRNTERKKQSQF